MAVKKDPQVSKKQLRWLRAAFLTSILSALANAVWLVSIPSGEGVGFLFNLSLARLALLVLLLTGAIASAVLLFFSFQKQNKMLKAAGKIFGHPKWPALSGGAFLIMAAAAWVMLFAPPYLLGRFFSISERLRPLTVWVFSALLALILAGLAFRNKSEANKRTGIAAILIPAAGVFFLALILWQTYPLLTEDLWFGRYSVPLLATQIVFSWLFVTLARHILLAASFNPPAWLKKHLDLILFIGLWIIAVALWLPQPIEFMDDLYYTAIEQHLRPLPPANAIQPWKDSSTYYWISESVWIGKGIYRSIDKSLFLTVLSVLNRFAGGDFARMLDLQVFLLAFFPPVVYLVGKKTTGRSTGLLAGLLLVFQEKNALSIMDEFPLVSARVLLSEPYMALWTALLVLALVHFLGDSKKARGLPVVIAGAALGFSALFRLNTVVCIPFIFLLFLIEERKINKRLWARIAAFSLGVLLAFTPWMIHNTVRYNNPVAFIRAKVGGVIIDNRYEKITGQMTENSVDGEYKLAGLDPSALPLKPQTGEMRSPLGEAGKYTQLALSILRHFSNNLITSFSHLPVSAVPQDLFHGSRAQQLWGKLPSGDYQPINPAVIILNLAIVGLGIAYAVRQGPSRGLAPLAVYLGYHLSNGLAISSGNRYTQPATWMVIFYFAAGLTLLSTGFLSLIFGRPATENIKDRDNQNKKSSSIFRTVGVIVGILLIGAAPAAADLLPSARYPDLAPAQIMDLITQDPACQTVAGGIDIFQQPDIMAQIESGELSASIGIVESPMILNGELYKLLYPRSKRDYAPDARFLQFRFMDLSRNYPQLLSLPLGNNSVDLQWKDDVMVVYNDSSEIILLAVLDSDSSMGPIKAGEFNFSGCYASVQGATP